MPNPPEDSGDAPAFLSPQPFYPAQRPDVSSLEARVYRLEDLVSKLEDLVGDMRNKLSKLESQVQANTVATNAVKEDTAEIVSLLKGFKVLGVIAKAGAAIAALWIVIKGGNKPW